MIDDPELYSERDDLEILNTDWEEWSNYRRKHFPTGSITAEQKEEFYRKRIYDLKQNKIIQDKAIQAYLKLVKEIQKWKYHYGRIRTILHQAKQANHYLRVVVDKLEGEKRAINDKYHEKHKELELLKQKYQALEDLLKTKTE
jgi:hypothetical protein